VVNRIEPRPRWEKHFAAVGYVARAAWNATFWHGINMRLIADGEEIKGHYLMGLASNIHLYAGGIAQLSPQARMDDGIFDFWLFEGDTLGDTVQCAWELFAGKNADNRRVRQITFKSLLIETEADIFMQVDGEPLYFDGRSVELRVQKQAMRVLTPANTPWELFMERNEI
jgi:diacylglycerol kinase family enzyme